MNKNIAEKTENDAVVSCSLFILHGVMDYISDSELGDTETGEYIKQMLHRVYNLLAE